jgi:hypothetical protein
MAEQTMEQGMSQSHDYRAPQNLIEIRTNTCLACEHLDEDKLTCNACGCPIMEKLIYLPQPCPLNKWEKFPGPEDEINVEETN